MLPYNNPNQLSQLLLQQAIQPQTTQKVVEVTGRAGAESYQIGPDSSTLLLDNTAPIVWLVKTDGAGYKTLMAYDIKPHEDVKPADHFKELEDRISKLEETVNARQPNTSKVKRNADSAE